MFRAAYGVGPTPGWDDIEGPVSDLACDGQRRRFPLNTRQWWKRQSRHRNPAPCGGLPGELIKWAAWDACILSLTVPGACNGAQQGTLDGVQVELKRLPE